MSACCASEGTSRGPAIWGKLDFAKMYNSGFERERKTVHHPDVEEKCSCEKVDENPSTIPINDSDEDYSESEEDTIDMLLVDGNDGDFEECDDEDALVERVWWLSKPPYVPLQTRVVSARRVQVCKERLSPTVRGTPAIRAALKDQVTKNLRAQSSSRRQKLKLMEKSQSSGQIGCGKSAARTIPACARKLSDIP